MLALPDIVLLCCLKGGIAQLSERCDDSAIEAGHLRRHDREEKRHYYTDKD
jgi:hypothetical protein